MEVFIKVVQLLLSLSILVVCHEFGHFLFAKLFKMRVEKFFLFFDPWFKLFSKKIGETEYGVGWLPLGGYVKIAGMIDESMDKEQMKQPAQEWEFRSKPAWQRLLVMIGGVTVNVILAFSIYIGVLFAWGQTYLPAENVKYGVVSTDLYHTIGVETGDIVVGVNGQPLERFEELTSKILIDGATSMQVRRNGEEISLDIPKSFLSDLMEKASERDGIRSMLTPRIVSPAVRVEGFADYSAAYDAGLRRDDYIIAVNGYGFKFYDEFQNWVHNSAAAGHTDLTVICPEGKITDETKLTGDTLKISLKLPEDGMLGIYSGMVLTEPFETRTQYYSFFQAIPEGIKLGINQLGSYVKSLGLLFSSDSGYKSVGGFMTMGDIFPGLWDWHSFWSLTALISIMLAVVNILPIPALDGGHVAFLIYEVVTRRKPSEKVMEIAQWIGMAILLGLFLLANLNDFIKFFL